MAVTSSSPRTVPRNTQVPPRSGLWTVARSDSTEIEDLVRYESICIIRPTTVGVARLHHPRLPARRVSPAAGSAPRAGVVAAPLLRGRWPARERGHLGQLPSCQTPRPPPIHSL